MTGEEKKRIRNYYEGTQYELSNFSSNIPNLFVDTIEIFNPVKNIVQGLVNSSINNLKVGNKKLQDEIWVNNNMKLFAQKICKEMYLSQEIVVEVILRPDKTVYYIFHDIEDIETKESNGEIIYFKVEGTIDESNNKGEIITKSYKREYILDTVTRKVIKNEEIDGTPDKTPFSLDKIPVIKFVYKNNLFQSLNNIDRINETEAFIRAIQRIHGDPMLHASNVSPFADDKNEKGKENVQKLNDGNYKKKRIIHTKSDKDRAATFKYIELTNPLIPEMQTDIDKKKKNIMDLFPEYVLVDAQTQNVSSETFSMKNEGLKNKISDFRAAFLKGLCELDNIGLRLSSSSEVVVIKDYKYFDLFFEQEKIKKLESINTSLDILKKAKDLDMENQLEKKIKTLEEEIIKDFGDVYSD